MLPSSAKAREGDSGTDFDEVMSIIGFGKIHWLIFVTCGALGMAGFNETMGMAIIAPASHCDLSADRMEDRGAITVAAFLGMIVSSYFWGFICDIFGRRKMLLGSCCLTTLCSAMSMFMPTLKSFLVMRFLTGIFVAVPGIAAVAYLGEFCTNAQRKVVLNYMYMFDGLAMLYCPGLATYILAPDWSYPLVGGLTFVPWRLLGLLYSLPSLFATVMLTMLPNSPKFLLSLGEHDKAYIVLDRMCKLNTGKQLLDFGVQKLKPLKTRADFLAERYETSPSHWLCGLCLIMWRDTRPLFHEPYVHGFLLSCAIMFGLVLLARGMGIWFTDMRNRVNYLGYEHKEQVSQTVCESMTEAIENDIQLDAYVCNDTFRSFRDSIILGITFIVVYNILGLLLRYAPRKLIFIGSLIISGLCGVSLMWAKAPWMIVVLFVLFLALPGVVVSLLGASVVDLIPTSLRAKALCLCMTSARCGVVVGSFLLSDSLEEHCVATFNFFASSVLICALLAYFLPLDMRFDFTDFRASQNHA